MNPGKGKAGWRPSTYIRVERERKRGSLSRMKPLARWWSRWRRSIPSPESVPTSGQKLVRLPEEPYVFECRDCGKVFEARRLRPTCVECDSTDVQLMSV